jgi:hypothetical protein
MDKRNSSAAVQSGQILVRDITREQDIAAAGTLPGGIECLAIQPTAFSSQDKLRKLNLWTGLAQE